MDRMRLGPIYSGLNFSRRPNCLRNEIKFQKIRIAFSGLNFTHARLLLQKKWKNGIVDFALPPRIYYWDEIEMGSGETQLGHFGIFTRSENFQST